MYKVEMLYTWGWGDAEWTENDKPMRFATPEEAESEIDAFIADTEEAAANGNMDEAHKRSDYRVVEAT